MSTTLPSGYSLRTASHPNDFESFARLAVNYHAWLNVDLCFQNFEEEVASLPGRYASPAGCILLVSHSPNSTGKPQDIACVALRPLKQHSAGESSCNSIAACCSPATADLPDEQDPQVALRHPDAQFPPLPHAGSVCELKRLWVEHEHQQAGIGRVLIEAAMQAAKAAGYTSMLLDTLETLTAANKLYDKLGFVRTSPYYHNPLPGVVYCHKDL